MTLHADDDNTEGPKTMQKRVQIITNCTCLSCDKTSSTDCELSDENTVELPHDLFLNRDNAESFNRENLDAILNTNHQPEDIPELLEFLPNKTRSNLEILNFDPSIVTTKEQKYELNAKLIALLKSIQEEHDHSTNFNYDKAQLKELLNIIEGSEHQLSDKNLMEFVNFVNVHNSEDLELDLSRLKEVLTNFRKSQELTERHKQYGLGPAIEGSHHGMHNLKGSHIGMGIHDSKNSLESSENTKHFEKKHYIGEEQKMMTKMELGHLIRGPHHSMVLEEVQPSGVEEKLNVEPHMLKLNHAGTVMEYESHSNKQHPVEN